MDLESVDLENVDPAVRDAWLIKACEYMETHRLLPPLVFAAKLKTGPVDAIECVTIWRDRVLVVQRSPNDPDFPNKWHSPGKTLLNRQVFGEVLAGLAKNDETGIGFDHWPILAGVVNFPYEDRAHYVCLVFVRILASDLGAPPLTSGRWIPISELDRTDLVLTHAREIIPLAIRVAHGGQPEFREALTKQSETAS